jgi:hypothetical protein
MQCVGITKKGYRCERKTDRKSRACHDHDGQRFPVKPAASTKLKFPGHVRIYVLVRLRHEDDYETVRKYLNRIINSLGFGDTCQRKNIEDRRKLAYQCVTEEGADYIVHFVNNQPDDIYEYTGAENVSAIKVVVDTRDKR